MAADALAFCIARSSAAMVGTTRERKTTELHKEMLVLFQCQVIEYKKQSVWNADNILTFFQYISSQKLWKFRNNYLKQGLYMAV